MSIRLIGLVIWLFWAGAACADVAGSLHYVASTSDYVEIKPDAKLGNNLVIDLKYATTDNFMGQNLYGEFNRAWLHRIAAKKLKKALEILAAQHPGYKLVIYDALRPRSVQYLLWDKVKGTDKQRYVANPKGGSIHNYGFALDLSVMDETGKPLDMGTPFDDFTELAQPRQEQQFLKTGKLTAQQVQNRLLLRRVMEEAGFIQLPVEWWHFDALPKAALKGKYKIVE